MHDELHTRPECGEHRIPLIIATMFLLNEMDGYTFLFPVKMHLLKGQKSKVIIIKCLILKLQIKLFSCQVLSADTQHIFE